MPLPINAAAAHAATITSFFVIKRSLSVRSPNFGGKLARARR
jgi:hypothetical protein